MLCQWCVVLSDSASLRLLDTRNFYEAKKELGQWTRPALRFVC